MKFLVIGGGGREHAIAWHLKKESSKNQVFVFPGNSGMENVAHIIKLSDNDQAIIEYVKENKIDWTIVGPEAYLQRGIVDSFEKNGLNIFGPNKRAAMLEASKEFAKDFMFKYKIPTANYSTFTDFNKAKDYIYSLNSKIVLKADGLAAGKGVYLPASTLDAELKLKGLLSGKLLGDAGKKVVIEEFVEGTELSYMIFTDGKHFKPLASAKDFKRLLDNDMGDNTGGMGVYSPSPILTRELNSRIEQEIVFPTLDGLRSENIEYKGVLYIGLFITPTGPKVCEYNVRFGDPETQAILMRLDTPLVEIFESVKNSTLDKINIQWSKECSGGVVIASPGYPGEYKKNIQIKGIELVQKDVIVFHAGTKKDGEKYVSSGGRVLNVMAKDVTFSLLFEKIYTSIENIDFPGMHYRKDICPIKL